MDITTTSKPSMVCGVLFSVLKGWSNGDSLDYTWDEIVKETGGQFEFTLPCGNVASYKSKDDIPLRSVRCPCGDRTHWLFKWVKY